MANYRERQQRDHAFPLSCAARSFAHSFTVCCNVYVAYTWADAAKPCARGRSADSGSADRCGSSEPHGSRSSGRRDLECVRASPGATPASVALGKLVERELAAARRRSAPDAIAVTAVVDEARSVAAELQDLISRLDPVRDVADPPDVR